MTGPITTPDPVGPPPPPPGPSRPFVCRPAPPDPEADPDTDYPRDNYPGLPPENPMPNPPDPNIPFGYASPVYAVSALTGGRA